MNYHANNIIKETF